MPTRATGWPSFGRPLVLEVPLAHSSLETVRLPIFKRAPNRRSCILLPEAIAEFGLDVFDDLGPNRCRKLGRSEHAHDQVRRESRFLMVPAQDTPRGATRQPEHLS